MFVHTSRQPTEHTTVAAPNCAKFMGKKLKKKSFKQCQLIRFEALAKKIKIKPESPLQFGLC